MRNKLISVVMPIYDRTDILIESIESVLFQSYPNIELLLIMDDSPLNTKKIVMNYRHHPVVRIFTTFNQTGNACIPRNIGIKEAYGDYIAFQDSDDLTLDGRFQTTFDELQNCDMIYGDYNLLNNKDYSIKAIKTSQANLTKQLQTNYIPHLTVSVRKDVLLKAGGFKRKMDYCEDAELWTRLFYLGYNVKHINKILATYRLHDNNLEKTIGDLAKWQPILEKEYTKVPKQLDLVDYKEIIL